MIRLLNPHFGIRKASLLLALPSMADAARLLQSINSSALLHHVTHRIRSKWQLSMQTRFKAGRLLSKRINRHGVRNGRDRKSTRLNSSHSQISYAVFCLKKKTKD